MREATAEALIEFHCTKPEGVMISARDSLLFDEAAFDELIGAIRALEEPYKRRTSIPRRVAACLCGLSEEIHWIGKRSALEGEEEAARGFDEAASSVGRAISRALWRDLG